MDGESLRLTFFLLGAMVGYVLGVWTCAIVIAEKRRNNNPNRLKW